MKDLDTLLSELMDGFSLRKTQRERENLCADAYGRMVVMQKALKSISVRLSTPVNDMERIIRDIAREGLEG